LFRSYRYKPDGLMKQSFSITTMNHQKLHLISYFARPISGSQDLIQPSQDPQLKNIRIPPGMYPESTVHATQHVPTTITQQPPMLSATYPSPVYTMATVVPDPRPLAYHPAIPQTTMYPWTQSPQTVLSPLNVRPYAHQLSNSPIMPMAEPLPQPLLQMQTGLP